MTRTTHKRLATVGFFLTGILLAAWPVSLRWGVGCSFPVVQALLGVKDGCAGFVSTNEPFCNCYIEPGEHRQFTWFVSTEGHFAIFALWIPALLFAIPSYFLWRIGRRPLPGHCPCGYDLTGNVSGRCPECGREVDGAKP